MPTSLALAIAALALIIMAIWRWRERRPGQMPSERARPAEETERRQKAIADINERLERLRSHQHRIAQETESDPRRAADAVRKIMHQGKSRNP
ncbi:MAG: hypothetical protein N3A66_04545 [Planctomycetota bacterium]|nr:hypothetical protein [Planctomycetota bacterium]